MLSRAAALAAEQELKSHVERLQRQVDKLAYESNPDMDNSLALGETDMDLEDDAVPQEAFHLEDVTIRPPEAPLTPPLRSSTPYQQSPAPSQPSWAHPGIDDIIGPRLSPRSSRPPSAPPFPAHRMAQIQAQSAARLTRIEFKLHDARNEVEEKDRAIQALKAQLDVLRLAARA